MSSSDWLISLSIVSSSSIHLAACVRTSQLESILCTEHILFLHSAVEGHLGSFYLWATVKNNLVRTGVQIPVFIREVWRAAVHGVTGHKI